MMSEIECCRVDIWEPIVVPAHAPLFKPERMRTLGNYFRTPFDVDGSLKWETTIAASDCTFSQGSEIAAWWSGFDLPLTFTPPDTAWNGKWFMILAQDPLRQIKNDPALTVTTPWVFHNAGQRELRFRKRVWWLADAIIKAGYGVYISDANKLYLCADKKSKVNPVKSKDTLAAERHVLTNEIRLLADQGLECVVGFGNSATTASREILSDFGLKVPVNSHPHPTARFFDFKAHYGTVDGGARVTANAIIAEVAQVSGVKLSPHS